MNKAYEQLTNTILDLLAQGTVPWKQPFSRMQSPRSAQTGKQYRGMNLLLLQLQAMREGYTSPFWLTFKQASDRGATVRKGEKGARIFFFSPLYLAGGKVIKSQERVKALINSGETVEKKFFFKSFVVFNRDQIDGLSEDELQGEEDNPDRNTADPIHAAEAIVEGYEGRPRIRRAPGSAHYSPATDIVSIPEAKDFRSDEMHYSVLFHELAHSTGHQNRLARFSPEQRPAAFGSADYGKEELIAELTAAFLCGEAGIDSATVDNSAAYIDGWRKAISSDLQIVAKASSAAAKAADHILGR